MWRNIEWEITEFVPEKRIVIESRAGGDSTDYATLTVNIEDLGGRCRTKLKTEYNRDYSQNRFLRWLGFTDYFVGWLLVVLLSIALVVGVPYYLFWRIDHTTRGHSHNSPLKRLKKLVRSTQEL